MSVGVWLGVIERTEESTIGTNNGIVKCRTINRLPENQRWDKEKVLNLKGSPWSPVQNAKGDHTLVEIKDIGEPTATEGETMEKQEEIRFEEEPNMSNAPTSSGYKGAGTIEFHIKMPMAQKYGYTEGCPACQKLKGKTQDGRAPTGRLGVNHSVACKTRIMHRMAEDRIDRHIVEAYHQRNQRGESNKSAAASQVQVVQRSKNQDKNTTIPRAQDNGDDKRDNDNNNTECTRLEMMLSKLVETEMDIAETYSPERVTTVAKRY